MEFETQVRTPAADARQALFGTSPDPSAEILRSAAAQRASHVHLEPEGGWIRVRMRIGGRLSDVLRLPAGTPLAFDGAEAAEMDGRIVLHLD